MPTTITHSDQVVKVIYLHLLRRDRPGDQPPDPDDSMRRGPGGAGEPGKVRARRPRYRSVWFSPSGEAPRRAWGRTGGTAPGDDDQAGGKEETGSPPPTSGLERPEGAARRPGVARAPADGEGGLYCPEGNIGRGQNAAPNPAATRGPPARAGGAGRGGAGRGIRIKSGIPAGPQPPVSRRVRPLGPNGGW